MSVLGDCNCKDPIGPEGQNLTSTKSDLAPPAEPNPNHPPVFVEAKITYGIQSKRLGH